MRLARRALFAALTMLMLCAVVSAQALRPEDDPRNLSPAVGTGGPVAGPTGLFTIYDGQTLRRGEFTFSIAYSNFDRDPGNVDLTEVPLSFNIGLSDHLELFFNTTAWRGIKVNNPRHLSSFYLPNSQLRFPALGSGPAIVQAPNGLGSASGTALFRPAFNQPFVQFPFVGGSAGTFGQGPGCLGCLFGFPGFTNATLGPPVSSGNSGNFGPADNFPGIGSVVGGILPGVVLATATLPTTIIAMPTVVPTTFTIQPAYLPDAPFINRLYGTSSFTSMVLGAKWRWTGPRNPFGIGIMPFYRFYPDKADDLSGFNQMQRGAGPGGDIGDFGLVLFIDGRLSRSVNISTNFGYILNSNPKGSFPGGEFTLLDRPDEFIAGLAFDFPVNKHFQPVLELRSTQYVGGRTPNAFENSPVEGLAGVKIYPRRWFGFGLAYRMHLNQQDRDLFSDTNANTTINQITNVNVGGTVLVVPATTRPATVAGFPIGFEESNDPHGFIGQFWIGRRNPRTPEFLPNQPPTVTLSASSGTITLPCPPGTSSATCNPSGDRSVQLSANATDPDGDTLLYTYTTTGGRVTGDGANVSWDLSGVQPGTYTATVEVDDGCGCVAFSSTTVTITECTNCVPPCPTLSISCPTDQVQAGTPATVSVNVSGGDPNASVTYNWTVSAGTITGGQGTPSITIDTTGLAGQNVTATVELGGLPPECDRTESCSFSVAGNPPLARKFDEYADLRFNDEKARLDNFAIQLQQEPGAQGFYVIFGSCEGEGDQRSARAVDYLVNNRGIDRSRITVVNGGCREQLTVELWIRPTGAADPTPSNSATVDPCPECKTRPRPRARRRGARRRGEE